MRKIAYKNTLVYRKVFHCYPDDSDELEKKPFKKKACACSETEEYLKEHIQGHIVEHPIMNLEDKIKNMKYKFL